MRNFAESSIIINIPDTKQAFFLELLQNLPFVQVESTVGEPINEADTLSKSELIQDIKEALTEVKQHRQGHKQLRSAWELLREL